MKYAPLPAQKPASEAKKTHNTKLNTNYLDFALPTNQ